MDTDCYYCSRGYAFVWKIYTFFLLLSFVLVVSHYFFFFFRFRSWSDLYYSYIYLLLLFVLVASCLSSLRFSSLRSRSLFLYVRRFYFVFFFAVICAFFVSAPYALCNWFMYQPALILVQVAQNIYIIQFKQKKNCIRFFILVRKSLRIKNMLPFFHSYTYNIRWNPLPKYFIIASNRYATAKMITTNTFCFSWCHFFYSWFLYILPSRKNSDKDSENSENTESKKVIFIIPFHSLLNTIIFFLLLVRVGATSANWCY